LTALRNKAIAVKGIKIKPVRQKIAQSIGNQETRVAIAPKIAAIGKEINMPKMNNAKRFSKKVTSLSMR
jgi:hypothetical protein